MADDGGTAGNQPLAFPLEGPEKQVKSQFWGADGQGDELDQAAAGADGQNGDSGQDSLKRTDHRRPHRVGSSDKGAEQDLSVRPQHIGHLCRQARPRLEASEADGEDGALGDEPEYLAHHGGRFHGRGHPSSEAGKEVIEAADEEFLLVMVKEEQKDLEILFLSVQHQQRNQ